MPSELEHAQHEVQRLQEKAATLASALQEAADGLEQGGVLPADGLRRELAKFREGLAGLGEMLPTRPESLDAAAAALDDELLRDRGLAVLERCLTIEHRENDAFAPLVACQDDARRLEQRCLEETSEMDPELEDLLAGQHALNALVQLVESPPELSDDEWLALNERLTTSYGQPLSTALLRGRLRFRGAEDPPSIDAAAADPPAIELPLSSVSPLAPPDIPADPELPAASAPAPPPAPPLPGELRPVSVTGQTAHSPRPAMMDSESLAELARLAAGQSGTERHERISVLILHLLELQRYGLAFHLARCLEQQPAAAAPVVPSSLISTLAFSERIEFKNGHIARQLQERFRRYDREAAGADEDWRSALGLLVRAAALRPAIIAPKTGAAAALCDFQITQETSQLHNYCLRVVSYGKQVQGMDTALFQQVVSEPRWEHDLAELDREIESWFHAAPSKTIEFAPANQLFLHANWSVTTTRAMRQPALLRCWSCWQEAARLAYELMLPVRAQQTDRVAWVKAELDRVATAIDAASGPEPASSDAEELQQHLQQALTLARRWVSLRSNRPGGLSYISFEAEQLRDEIVGRHDAVLDELAAFAREHPSPACAAAIACLRRVIHGIRRLFDPQPRSVAKEADVRHLLHAELLKAPKLRMNPQWEPEVDALTLESSLLELLAADACDWTAAFHLQCEQRDHAATQRILELDVWDDATRREELEAHRERRLQQCRQTLKSDVAVVRAQVTEADSTGLLAAHDRDAFLARLDRLRNGINTTLDFPAANDQLHEISTSVARLRQQELQRAQQRLESYSSQRNAAPESSRADLAQAPPPAADPRVAEQESTWVMDFL